MIFQCSKKKIKKDPLDSYVWNEKIKLFYFDE